MEKKPKVDDPKDPLDSASSQDINVQDATVAQVSAEDTINDLKKAVQSEAAKYLYLYADFENYKKRSLKEREDYLKYGWEGIARDLLNVLDNLERARSFAPPESDAQLLVGLDLVIKEYKAAFQKRGVQTIETIGKIFDPALHDAVGQKESEAGAGTIIGVEQAGYTLHGRLLRPAKVILSLGLTNIKQ